MERSYGGTGAWRAASGEIESGISHNNGILWAHEGGAHLIDLFLTRRRTVVGDVGLAVAVAGLAVGAGAAAVTQLLLLVPPLILVLVVEHGLEIHHGPSVPGLWTDRTNWTENKVPCLLMMSFSSRLRDICLLVGYFLVQTHKRRHGKRYS